MLYENENELEDELLFEYDFSPRTGGVKGKYAERYKAGTNLVLLEPDVAKAFPTAESGERSITAKTCKLLGTKQLHK
ncbi:hypothetical protein CAL7716_026800 [Calothrix sp. PCC 7716]|nr:hypothetical protein CAL7716_026800 [Calothrix sp. PCC 7716]